MKLQKDSAMSNAENTVGMVAVESPHNEKPTSTVSVQLMIEALEILRDMGHREVHIWLVEPNGAPTDSPMPILTETTARPKVGMAVAPRMVDYE